MLSCSRPSLNVALDGAGVARLRLVRILAEFAPSPPLAEQVPALIQHDLNCLESAMIVGGQLATIALLEERVLLGHELIDVL
jgi:hypothetical protein